MLRSSRRASSWTSGRSRCGSLCVKNLVQEEEVEVMNGVKGKSAYRAVIEEHVLSKAEDNVLSN